MATRDERLEAASKKIFPMLEMTNKEYPPIHCVTTECAWFV